MCSASVVFQLMWTPIHICFLVGVLQTTGGHNQLILRFTSPNHGEEEDGDMERWRQPCRARFLRTPPPGPVSTPTTRRPCLPLVHLWRVLPRLLLVSFTCSRGCLASSCLSNVYLSAGTPASETVQGRDSLGLKISPACCTLTTNKLIANHEHSSSHTYALLISNYTYYTDKKHSCFQHWNSLFWATILRYYH